MKKLPIPRDCRNLLPPENYISFWEQGEMAYTAIQKINELKANNELEKAKTMLAEWIFQKKLRQEINKIFEIQSRSKVN